MKKFIISICKKNKVIRKIVRFSSDTIKRIQYSFFKITNKTNPKKILFESFQGRSFACSPKALYLEMLQDERFSDYEFIWCFKDTNREIPMRNTKIVKSNSKAYYKELASSKYWIVNALIPEAITPKKDQVFVQCWHGTPLKKLRHDIPYDGLLNDTKEIKKRNDLDTKRYDYFISPSSFCTKVFTSSFNLKNLNKEHILIEEGYPRNVALFTYTNQTVAEIKTNLQLPKDKKVILYAPTFRDNQHTSGVGFTYQLGIDLDRLQQALENEYVILFRVHYFVSNQIDFQKYKGFIYDVSAYDDVNDLYIVSDLLITDYSSVFFDYANLRRPMLFYMYDLEEYQTKLRDFYIDLQELPGPIVEEEEDLIQEIKQIHTYHKRFDQKYEVFHEKFNYLDDKDSAKRVINVIFKEKK